MRNPISLSFLFLCTLIFIFSCKNEANQIGQKYPTKIIQMDPAKAADMAQKIRAEASVEVADGLDLSVWATDSLVSDPIAISVAPDGRIFYTSATRQSNSEFDVRGHRNWITASISFQTVEDRRAFLRKTFEADNEESMKSLKDLNEDGVRDWRDLTVEKEQVWFLTDKSGDGVADESQLYLEDFHEEITDVANGVEFHYGEVYISVGPDLWRTKDNDGDKIADEVTSISHGYAVHFGFSGHGMSGVTVGPDGRVWWGIGDIGMNVVDKSGKQWKYPNRGVVVRSEFDGSGFEVFCMGVRNTHEFVFDKYGNLITEDNDGDHSGERERLVYLINGSDTGWRINWQFGKYTDPDNNNYKVWMDEKMHVPRWDGQAAYFLPPIINYVNGPTGMCYNPGTALSPEWYDHFFIAEFRGTPSASPIHGFTMKPKGAGFELGETKEVVKGLLPTGLDFGADGALYFGDWINGWNTKDEGLIWKLDVPGEVDSPIRKNTKALLQADFSEEKETRLSEYLKHQDMRVRTKAQFELVKRGETGFKALKARATQNKDQLARIHGLWGMAQLARQKDMEYAKALVPFLKDADVEIIAQATKMIGDIKFKGASADLITLVSHESPRVRFFATEALGRTADANGIDAILAMLKANNDEDTYLRMAGMIALGRIGKAEPMLALKGSDSKAVRTVAVVALRRMEHEGIAEFLNDADEYIVAEAARGINDDFSIEAALPALANVLKETRFTSEPLLRRAINANLRVGKKENIQNLIDYANQASAPIAMRAEAIAALSTWEKSSVFDRVDGRYRGAMEREITPAQSAFTPIANVLLENKNEAIQVAAAKATAKLGVKESAPLLFSLLKNNAAPKVRVAALSALHLMGFDKLENALEIAMGDKDKSVRSKAVEILPESKISETKAIVLFDKVIKTGSVNEQQAALASLSQFKGQEAVTVLSGFLTQLINGKIAPEIQLDVIEAVNAQNDATLVTQLKAHQDAQSKTDPLAAFRPTLAGGNKDKGHDIFYEHEAAQCTRCHAIWEYGGNAGPVLDGVASRLSDEQLLSALVTPSAEYAEGYEIVVLDLKDGTSASGTVLERTADFVKLKIGKEDIRSISQTDIKSSTSVPSSMIAQGTILNKKEIRDLITFLKTLKKHDG